MPDARELIRSVFELEPVAATRLRLGAIAGDPNWDLSEVRQAVAFDPVLVARILALAQDSEPRPATLDQALVAIGSGRLLALVTEFARKRAGEDDAFRRERETQVFRHGAAACVAAGCAAEVCGRELPAAGATAAVLHDIGALLMQRFLPEEELLEVDRRARLGISIEQAETAVLGIHHGELAGLLVREWNIAPVLQAALVNHHDPQEQAGILAYVVHLADFVARRIGHGLHDPASLAPETYTLLAIDEAGVEELCRRTITGLAERFVTLNG